ncbi:succinate-acetate transporter protein [Kribbella voronezhensis]|uniref:Succinate-acetate transporter protein n=1 Tax=Kribbella voronezhensis TaxID=2512212 RepID=A0A4R7TA80_9ACTN|nr:GPR1/FUN34/YaaH family transporter [Kribbella voronezhensis]TDU88835.1 succinate-acetate transporter protein [Kribbella voronezhensis]
MSDRTETPAEASAGDALRERVVISLRPIGAPTSIGLYGLGAASWVLAGLQLGWIPAAEGKKVALVLVGFAFVAQLLASMFGFLGRDGTVGTAMGVLALTWLVTGLILHASSPGATSDALGLFLLFSGTTMLLLSITVSSTKLVVTAVFAVAAIRFLVAGGYELNGSTGWEHVSGVLGLLLVVMALYAAFGAGLEDALGRTVLPLGRRGEGKVAVQGSLLEQVRKVTNEPGVRTKL